MKRLRPKSKPSWGNEHLHQHAIRVVKSPSKCPFGAGTKVVYFDNLMLLLHTVRAVLRDASMSEMADAVQSEVSKMMDDVGRLDDRVSKLINHFTQAQSDLNAIQISSRKITSRGQKIEEIEVSKLPSVEN